MKRIKILNVTRYLWLVLGMILGGISLTRVYKTGTSWTTLAFVAGCFASFMVAYVQNRLYEKASNPEQVKKEDTQNKEAVKDINDILK